MQGLERQNVSFDRNGAPVLFYTVAYDYVFAELPPHYKITQTYLKMELGYYFQFKKTNN